MHPAFLILGPCPFRGITAAQDTWPHLLSKAPPTLRGSHHPAPQGPGCFSLHPSLYQKVVLGRGGRRWGWKAHFPFCMMKIILPFLLGSCAGSSIRERLFKDFINDRALRILLSKLIVCRLQLSRTVMWSNTHLTSVGGMTWVVPCPGPGT